MTRQACFTLAVRAHELHEKGCGFMPTSKDIRTWEAMSWYFLLLWSEP